MINSELIIKYTNALYSTPEEYAPRYDEFRDMFSSGQIRSKEWIIKELNNLNLIQYDKTFLIAGAWYGTLGMMIKDQFPGVKVTMLDIDPRCEKFINNMIYDMPDLKSVTEDMYKYAYNEDVIVNTSCEHILDIQEWLSLIPKNKLLILQSNNYDKGNGHINCVHSKEEFIKQTGLANILYSGKLEMPMYTRYMVIGNV